MELLNAFTVLSRHNAGNWAIRTMAVLIRIRILQLSLWLATLFERNHVKAPHSKLLGDS